jgi:hypothetical protein
VLLRAFVYNKFERCLPFYYLYQIIEGRYCTFDWSGRGALLRNLIIRGFNFASFSFSIKHEWEECIYMFSSSGEKHFFSERQGASGKVREKWIEKSAFPS